MGALRQRWQREQFDPTALGLLVNPYYFARRGLLRELTPLLGQLRGDVLDVGCGRMPYRKFTHAARYVGVDIDTAVTRDHGVADVYYDGGVLPFPAASFDAVLCSQVLEHVFEPEAFLQEIARVLRPGGTLVLSVPFVWDEHEQPQDFGRYSSFGLIALLERNGLTVEIHRKAVAGAWAIVQLASGFLFKITRSRSRVFNLVAQLVVIAPVNILGGACALVLPKSAELYLDNIVLARKSPVVPR
jgi:SAM-dependent methyltransferase